MFNLEYCVLLFDFFNLIFKKIYCFEIYYKVDPKITCLILTLEFVNSNIYGIFFIAVAGHKSCFE